jgi:hypothetical protein
MGGLFDEPLSYLLSSPESIVEDVIWVPAAPQSARAQPIVDRVLGWAVYRIDLSMDVLFDID